MLKVHGLTTCVGYSEYLAQTLPTWMRELTSLTVVTTPEDVDTQNIILHYPSLKVGMHTTNKFTENGAYFNKGAAMEEARLMLPWEDWVVLFDADILPPRGWLEAITPSLVQGHLHGCYRYQIDYKLRHQLIPDDRFGYGYFQLFHSSDHPHKSPLLSTHYRHAGNYDSDFLSLYKDKVINLPIQVGHFGDNHNWFGIGRQDLFDQMEKDRKEKGSNGPLERI